MRDFRKLAVWQKCHALTLRVYHATASFPRDEVYGLTSQLRRSCASSAANIAEGCGRASEKDFARFLTMSMGSASETEYHILPAFDLGYLQESVYQELIAGAQEVKRMLAGLLRRINGKSQQTSDNSES